MSSIPHTREMDNMKIVCTKKEKEQLIASLFTTEYCPTFLTKISNCIFNDEVKTCVDCLNKYIDWEITNEDNLH